MSYILLADDEEDILDMLEMIAASVVGLKIEKVISGNEALKTIARLGPPLLIISDFKMPDGDGSFLYTELNKQEISTPFIVCSGNPSDQLKTLFPDSALVIQKPHIMKPLKEYLLANFQKTILENDYVTVPIGLMRRLGFVKFDIFVQLNEAKYLKVFCSGDALDKDDCDNVETKFLNRLFMLKNDALEMVKEFEAYLDSKMLTDVRAENESEVVQDVLKTVSLFCKAIGWSPESVSVAKKSVEFTTLYLKKNRDFSFLLDRKPSNDFYGDHISQLSLLCCLVAQNIGWHSEITQQKLVIACLMHDHFVDTQMYDDVELLRAENVDPRQNKNYFQHPIKAAELARSLKGLPSDIDHILLEHHELPNGSGFPRGLSASRISSLSALFIICEAMVLHFHAKPLTSESFDSFWLAHPDFLIKDPFKKIAVSIKNGATSARS